MKQDISQIDLTAVINSKSAWDINKSLATKIAYNTYFTPGDFYKQLSDDDSIFLYEKCMVHETDEDVAAELFLMTMLLCMAEGVHDNGDDALLEYWYQTTVALITFNHLHRAALIELMYDKISYGEECRSVDIVKATEEGAKIINSIFGLPE